MMAAMLHKAYEAVEFCEKAWNTDPEQIRARSTIIVRTLFDLGLLNEAALCGGMVVESGKQDAI